LLFEEMRDIFWRRGCVEIGIGGLIRAFQGWGGADGGM
jgi:hypothetical protein